MKSKGAVIYASQWQGWVPGDCGGWGDLHSSVVTVKGLKISGRVVNGPEPKRCGAPSPPAPSPAPSPNPPGQCSTNPGQNNNGVNMEATARTAASPSECCSLCQAASGCKGYTHVTANDECWLKSQLGSLTNDPDVNSGSFSPSPTPPAPTPAPVPGPTPAPTPAVCQCACTGDDLKACVAACPSDQFTDCINSCQNPCATTTAPPSPGDCPGGSLANCVKSCPSDATFQVCVQVCEERCEGGTSCGNDDGEDLAHCVQNCPSDKFEDCVGCCQTKFPSVF